MLYLLLFFFLMIRRPPRYTRTDTLFPYTPLFRAHGVAVVVEAVVGEVGADFDQLHGIAVRVRRGRGSIATCCCAGWGTMHAVWRSGCRASDARPWVRWLSGFAGVDGDVRNAACDGSREARPQEIGRAHV